MKEVNKKNILTLKSVLKTHTKTSDNTSDNDNHLVVRRKKKIFINNANKKTTNNNNHQSRIPTPSKNKHKLAFRKLEESFPNIFHLKKPRPLCVGIREQLIKLKDKKISNNTVRLGLYFYCNSYQYLPVIIEGADRIDINGNKSGFVTKDEEIIAAEKYSKMIENN